MVKRKHAEIAPDLSWVEDHVSTASIAYKKENYNDPSDKIKIAKGWEFYKTIKGSSGVQLKMWISPKTGNVMCAFRGTSSLKELKLDATVGSTIFRNSRGENVGYVYKGFGIAWEDIKSQLADEMKLLKNTNYIQDGTVLQFTGHSLGGSLSEIAATYFSEAYPNVQVVETSIGAPSTGDKHFGDYSRSLPNLQRVRIVAPGDSIANVKLPGMEFTETNNVINFKDKRGKGAKLWSTFVSSLAKTSPALAIGNQLYDAYNNHTLQSYTDILVKDFQDSSVLTLQDDPNKIVDNQESAYQKSKTNSAPVDDGSCMCECHIYDSAMASGKIPPQSLGTIPKMSDPSSIKPIANKIDRPKVDTGMQMKQTTDNEEKQSDEEQMANMDEQSVMDYVNEALDKSKDDTKEKVQKLQEKYTLLTNQEDADADPVTLERNRYNKAIDDMSYFDNRINMEMEHPEYVPNDADGTTKSRDTAVKFKNKLTRIYSLIMQNRTRVMASTMGGVEPPKKTEDQITRAMVTDQAEQIQETTKDNQLDPDQQPNNYVFDLDLLNDLDGDGTTSSKQIDEWLQYAGMTPGTLYDNLKSIATNSYRNGRLKDLRNNEQINRESSAAKIKAELETIGTQHEKQKKLKREFFTKAVKTSGFIQMYKSGKLDLDKVMSSINQEGDDRKVMQSLLGFTDTTDTALQESYYKDFATNMVGATPEQYAQAQIELNRKLQMNKMYPWINKEQYGPLYDKYKNDPLELSKQAENLRPTIPSEFMTSSNEDFGVDNKLLKKGVEALPDASNQLRPVQFKDYYAEERKRLDDIYGNSNELKKLFDKWNNYDKTKDTLGAVTDALTGGFFTNKMFHGWEKLANGGKPVDGWFDKGGNWMGYAASPDFEAYAKNHPELGFKYVGPTTNKFLDAMDSVHEMAGEYAGARFGINPNTALDSAKGMVGMGGKTSYDNATGVLSSGDKDEEDSPGLTDAFNPMAFMMGGGGGGDDSKGETNPRKSTGNRGKNSVIPTTSKNNFRSRTGRVGFGK